MREKIDTIPINDAFHSGDECPFCYLERQAEQRAVKYTIGPGASYMEPEIRAITDREGFCRHHLKMMQEYGNALGCALILQTYYACLLEEFQEEAKNFTAPPKKTLFGGKKTVPGEPLWQRLEEKSGTVTTFIKADRQRHPIVRVERQTYRMRKIYRKCPLRKRHRVGLLWKTEKTMKRAPEEICPVKKNR